MRSNYPKGKPVRAQGELVPLICFRADVKICNAASSIVSVVKTRGSVSLQANFGAKCSLVIGSMPAREAMPADDLCPDCIDSITNRSRWPEAHKNGA